MKWTDKLTDNQKRKAGLLPGQKRARFARQAATLRRLGLGDTPEAQALRTAAKWD